MRIVVDLQAKNYSFSFVIGFYLGEIPCLHQGSPPPSPSLAQVFEKHHLDIMLCHDLERGTWGCDPLRTLCKGTSTRPSLWEGILKIRPQKLRTNAPSGIFCFFSWGTIAHVEGTRCRVCEASATNPDSEDQAAPPSAGEGDQGFSEGIALKRNFQLEVPN